jgi:hypothetical protein
MRLSAGLCEWLPQCYDFRDAVPHVVVLPHDFVFWLTFTPKRERQLTNIIYIFQQDYLQIQGHISKCFNIAHGKFVKY